MSWFSKPEVGSALGLRWAMFMMRFIGYRLSRWMTWFFAMYYAVGAIEQRRNLAAFHRRLLGQAGLWMSCKVIGNFAEGMTDRIFMLMGRAAVLRVRADITPKLDALVRQGRGALLVGAHVGSLEAARLTNTGLDYPITPLILGGMSPMFFRELRRIAPDLEERMLLIESEHTDIGLLIRERIERGELVAVLGDRVGMQGPTVALPFLGDEAEFPLGPHAIAAAVGCPSFTLMVGKTSPTEYEVTIEELGDGDVPRERSERRAHMKEMARTFVERLERHCRRHPYQWYNFFDFWGEFADAASGKAGR